MFGYLLIVDYFNALFNDAVTFKLYSVDVA